jgi:sortase A
MLRLNAGHVEGTRQPGRAGTVGIAGHRYTFFRELKDIRRNDEIQLQTAAGLYHYKVDWIAVVAPDDTDILAPSPRPVLTLVTCFPSEFLGSAPKRFVGASAQMLARPHSLQNVSNFGQNWEKPASYTRPKWLPIALYFAYTQIRLN